MNLYPDLLNIHFIKGGLFQKHFSLPLKHEKLRSWTELVNNCLSTFIIKTLNYKYVKITRLEN